MKFSSGATRIRSVPTWRLTLRRYLTFYAVRSGKDAETRRRPSRRDLRQTGRRMAAYRFVRCRRRPRLGGVGRPMRSGTAGLKEWGGQAERSGSRPEWRMRRRRSVCGEGGARAVQALLEWSGGTREPNRKTGGVCVEARERECVLEYVSNQRRRQRPPSAVGTTPSSSSLRVEPHTVLVKTT